MVVFTCNHCGESVKKASVEKHYQTRCRNAPIFVSCMDCQKDFKGEEYVAHTTCITEAEKYSGKDYVPKASHNAGLRKQETWLEVVRSILSSKDVKMTPDARHVLQKLQNLDNVPRKQTKFINFVINSLKISKYQAQSAWEVVEVALDKYKEIRFGPAKSTAPKSNGAAADVGNQVPADDSSQQAEAITNGDTSKTEKRKRKKGKHDNIVNGDHSLLPDESIPKKNSQHSENNAEETTLENITPNNEESEAPKKKKKKKAATDSTPTENGKPTNGDVPPKKNMESGEDAGNLGEPEAAITAVTNTPAKFDWAHEIISVLEKNSNEIKLEKLKHKVLKKYKKVHLVEEIPHKVSKTINKKLKALGFVVVNDVIKTRGSVDAAIK